jgi:hypothetical protein
MSKVTKEAEIMCNIMQVFNKNYVPLGSLHCFTSSTGLTALGAAPEIGRPLDRVFTSSKCSPWEPIIVNARFTFTSQP